MPDRRAARTGAHDPALLVFVHVPKTGGSTVKNVLKMNAPGIQTRMLTNVFKGGGGLNRSVIERLREGREPLDRRLRDLDSVRVLRGHFPLGIREFLPQHVAAGRGIRYFTFLRDPIDRVLSHFFAIRDRREDVEEQGKHTLASLPKEPTLDDMLERGYVHDNLHTRMLSGLCEPFDEVTDAMLEQAKGNLRDGLVFFGLTERFDESLVIAEQRLNLSRILYKAPSRVNKTRPRRSEIPTEYVRSAERSNRYDIELYRYACELFENAPERGQLEFEVELAALRAAKGHGRIHLDVPAPDGFGGTEEVWRMLVQARGGLLRQDFKLAEVTRLKHEVGDRAKGMQDELASVSSERERLAAELQAAIRGDRPAKGTAGSKRRRRSAKTSSPTQPNAADDGPADPLTAKKRTAKAARTRRSAPRERSASDTEGPSSDASAR